MTTFFQRLSRKLLVTGAAAGTTEGALQFILPLVGIVVPPGLSPFISILAGMAAGWYKRETVNLAGKGKKK